MLLEWACGDSGCGSGSLGFLSEGSHTLLTGLWVVSEGCKALWGSHGQEMLYQALYSLLMGCGLGLELLLEVCD